MVVKETCNGRDRGEWVVRHSTLNIMKRLCQRAPLYDLSPLPLFTCSHLTHLRGAAFLITYSMSAKMSSLICHACEGLIQSYSHTVIQTAGRRRLRFNPRANLCTRNGPQAKIGGYKYIQPTIRNLIALSVGVDQGRRRFHSVARSVLGNSETTARENNTFEMSSELSITITSDGTTSTL